MSSFKSASRCSNKVSIKCAARTLNSQLIAAPHSGAYSARSNRGATINPQKTNISALLNLQSKLSTARPNRSLNRTLHSVPAFVLAKTLAQIPSRCSGPVSFDVRPRRTQVAVSAPSMRVTSENGKPLLWFFRF
jgi:hypothetical protein